MSARGMRGGSRSPNTSADMDVLLDSLLAEWEDVAELAEESTTLDPADQELYQLEWTLAEEQLKQLRENAQEALLTPTQQCRYDELERLITRYHPTLETLFQGPRGSP